MYHASLEALERLNTSSLSLATLEQKLREATPQAGRDGANASQQQQQQPQPPATYAELLGQRLAQLRRVTAQLGETSDEASGGGSSSSSSSAAAAHGPELVFAPGRLVAALDALVAAKEAQLIASKALQRGGRAGALCQEFLHGRCSHGVTCGDSHTADALTAFVVKRIATEVDECGGSVLTLADAQFGPEAWAAIAREIEGREFASLVLRQADRHAVDTVAACVRASAPASVRHIDLSQNGIGAAYPRGLLRLAKALRSNTTLRGLSLAHNAAGAPGALAIVQALPSCPALTALNLGANGIAATPADAAFPHLCEALAHATSLRRLGLAQNPLGPDGVRRVLASLLPLSSSDDDGDGAFGACVSPQLEALDLFGTRAADGGAAAVGAFLLREQQQLQLQPPPPSPSRAAAEAAPPPRRLLRYLNVGWNGISAEGMAPLCAALATHPALEVLRAAYNPGIGRKGAMAVADAVRRNVTLSVLDLRWAGVGDDGASSLAEALAANRALRVLALAGNDIDPRTDALLADRMRRRLAAAGPDGPRAVLPPGVAPFAAADEVW